MKGTCYLLAFCILLWMQMVFSQFSPDEITTLPGLTTKPKFQQWSGYLNTTKGKYLHYWFTASQRDPAKDPLVLWLNGGPGCSSLYGLLAENGPFYVNDDGATLSENPFSWNTVANVLYLESPVGVGYSYSDDKKYQTNDEEVAENNYLALQSFFKKFPDFTQNEFYIIGESYGGIYVPTLGLKIMKGTANINFKGFAVGNGVSDDALNDHAVIYFGYYHGLFGETLWADLNRYCCKDGKCNFHNSTDTNCEENIHRAFQVTYDIGLNMYSLYKDCPGWVGARYQRFHTSLNLLFRFYQFTPPNKVGSTGHKGPEDDCINETAETMWLNQQEVRKALHISDAIQSWKFCSEEVTEGYCFYYTTMSDFYIKLLSSGLRVLVYNGDTDLVCNYLSGQWFVESLNQKPTSSYKPWLYNNQIAGFYQQYGNMTFLTVKGAGHMVPHSTPGAALKMFISFLTNSPY
ncbi:lysosomal protective protein-like [Protopterus annectens]|uniref:lysosomal protective protein-like n=1 Tax=Protopterus annectens TaxID=7888 RepID=UPI001CF94B33|nr:lysosomal protective protein-like [Protopterus annectens]